MPQTMESALPDSEFCAVRNSRPVREALMKSVKGVRRRAYMRLFLLLDAMGVHVLPKHCYTPVPDYTWLKQNRALWERRTSLDGVEWDLDRQVEWLREICAPYVDEVAGLNLYHQAVATGWGQGYGPVESQVLHCFVRAKSPRRVIEIGSGISTACLLQAARLNVAEGGHASEIVCIEPFPRKTLTETKDVIHIRQLCQTVPDAVFQRLRAGDLLFVDSSHSVKIGSDVMRICLEIIPSLAPGVFIHIHDIYLPYIYPRSTFHMFFGWQETALLLALLKHNSRLRVLSCLTALHYDRTRELAGLLRDYRPQENDEGLRPKHQQGGHFPSSIWLQTC